MFLLEELGSNAYQRSMKSANTRLIEMYHSRTDKGSVDRIMKGFVNSGGKIRVLVATVAFGMGIDLPDVDVIIHWGVEGTALSYWQELGRCARDGRKGIGKKVQVGKDQEKTQSEKRFPLQKPRWEKTKVTIRYFIP